MTSRAPLGSIAIPAHNEAGVVGRCLDTLLADFSPGEVEVVVACNGCTDHTADVVRSSGHPVRVIESATASKSAALRAADEALGAFPRIYLDADVILRSASARRVLEYLSTEGALAARPPIEYNLARSTRVVRSYYRARAGVPALMRSLWGAGCYGLSRPGRERFGVFPDVTNDDLFVDQHFNRSEVTIIDTYPVIVNVPRRTSDLLRVMRRARRGNAESRGMPTRPAGHAETASSTVRGLVKLAKSRPRRALDVTIYLMLAMLARGTLALAPSTSWERDDSSRSPL